MHFHCRCDRGGILVRGVSNLDYVRWTTHANVQLFKKVMVHKNETTNPNSPLLHQVKASLIMSFQHIIFYLLSNFQSTSNAFAGRDKMVARARRSESAEDSRAGCTTDIWHSLTKDLVEESIPCGTQEMKRRPSTARQHRHEYSRYDP